jgi:hypothetical protein
MPTLTRAWHISRHQKDPNTGCWVYPLLPPSGYAMVGNIRMARLVLYHTTGQLGDHALHSCNNPACINPAHLRWGTSKESLQDRRTRGRANRPKGDHHYKAKLTAADIPIIRELLKTWTPTVLAKHYRVSRNCIITLRDGKSWKHPT